MSPGVHADPTPPSAPPLADDLAARDDAAADARTHREDAGGPVHRALAILELLGSPDGRSSLGVVEIARQLGRDKSQVSRVLKLLADAGFVDREAGSLRYRVGARLFAIGATAVDQRLRAEADVVVERDAVRLGERVEVCVRAGSSAMTISTATPDSELRSVGWTGRTTPLASTAAGRALLFDAGDAEVARLLVPHGLAVHGPDAPRSLDDVLVRLRADRERGYALARQEMDRGLVALGAPVRDAAGRVVAAVAASGPESRLGAGLREASAVVAQAGLELSAALGHRRAEHGDTVPRSPGAPRPRGAHTTDTSPRSGIVRSDHERGSAR